MIQDDTPLPDDYRGKALGIIKEGEYWYVVELQFSRIRKKGKVVESTRLNTQFEAIRELKVQLVKKGIV